MARKNHVEKNGRTSFINKEPHEDKVIEMSKGALSTANFYAFQGTLVIIDNNLPIVPRTFGTVSSGPNAAPPPKVYFTFGW
ncbi:hypothetical protein PVK06_039037 [Gossypium arboreum]|uniref:Uncharacterized protein n=1 Tax=Gossypium arboreum TaxID=29729 RepID=A0ABR0N2G2_GOSAR|nr:hypothetical protein PVK06_039037 [Gossypium arboreum]